MEHLTLEQAADLYAPNNGGLLSRNAIQRQADFKAGAEWQKEQYKRIIKLIKEGIPVLLTEGFDDLVEQIYNELEQLQD